MPRNPRFVPPHSLQHVSDVVAQNRFRLTPSPLLNERFLGVLGKAQETFDMTICAVVVMASHFHLLLRPSDGKHLADFMCFLKTNLAKEIGRRLQNRSGPFFEQRYHTITVSDEEEAQIQVLRYILSHGVKELLVDSVLDWPGVHCAASLLDGKPMTGRWYDRCAESAARQRRGAKEVDEESFVTTQTVTLSPLPCWQHLAETTWRRYVAEMIGDIDRLGASERNARGCTSAGVAKVLAQDPHRRPKKISKSPQPLFHAATRKVFDAMVEVWQQVLQAYRAASELLLSGHRTAVFPEGTFPPALPFVPFTHPAEGVLGVLGARGQPA